MGRAASRQVAAVRGAGLSPYPFQHLLQVVSELHEQVDLPAGVAVHGVDLGKGRENPDARQTPSGWRLGQGKGPDEEVRGGPAQLPSEHKEEASSLSQGPTGPSTGGLGLPAWGKEKGVDVEKQAEEWRDPAGAAGQAGPEDESLGPQGPRRPLTSLQPALSLSS